MTTVTMTEARAKWYELIRRAESGEEITVTNRGRSVVKFISAKQPAGESKSDIASAL